jgi:hypothetical protein
VSYKKFGYVRYGAYIYDMRLKNTTNNIKVSVLPLAASGGFRTQNCKTKIKVKWNTKN